MPKFKIIRYVEFNIIKKMYTVINCHSEKKANPDTWKQVCHRRLDICSAFNKLWQRNAIETALDAYGEFPLHNYTEVQICILKLYIYNTFFPKEYKV